MHIHHFVIVEKKWMVSGMLEINAQVTDNVNYINFINFLTKYLLTFYLTPCNIR
jgi:hypothetical protein